MIERDGYPFVLLSGALATAVLAASHYLEIGWLLWVAIFVYLLTLFVAYFFRSPNRVAPDDDSLTLAPSDGLTLGVEELESYPGFDGPVYRISIFLSVLDVHVNWVPAAGKIESSQYFPGKFHKAFTDKASEENERTEIIIATKHGRVEFKQIAGILARRIVCRLEAGQEVVAGEKFGMIKFGSRTEVVISATAEILVRTGDKVKGAVTPLARMSVNS